MLMMLDGGLCREGFCEQIASQCLQCLPRVQRLSFSSKVLTDAGDALGLPVLAAGFC